MKKFIVPTRICDIGGWCDTWFARYGNIFNMAIYPGVEVDLFARKEKGIEVILDNYGDTVIIDPARISYEKHSLIAACIDIMDLPCDAACKLRVFSSMPAGASTGTSGALSVAIIKALAAYKGQPVSPYEAAVLAHRVEVELLQQQSGIQDQICASFGGVNYITMEQYPQFEIEQIPLPDAFAEKLQDSLILAYTGRPHNSSEIHKKVIASLGEEPSECLYFKKLRELANKAAYAVKNADLELLGQTMIENTDVQRSMNRELVCSDFEKIISISKHFGAIGWKINGAGGDGGSITILAKEQREAIIAAIQEENYTVIPLELAR